MRRTDGSDGGDAFPKKWDDVSGMSLRDFFAAKAMAAIIISNNVQTAGAAKDAYRMADLMLAERDK